MTTQIATVSTDVTSIFGWLGTLDQYISFVPFLSLVETVVGSVVLQGFMSGALGNTELVYWSIIFMLSMLYLSTGYVAVKTVNASVSFVTGLYYVYAGGSQFGDNLGYYEIAVAFGWFFWAAFQTIYGTYLASQNWDALDARVAEAKKDSIGLENAMSGEKTIKAVTLHMLVAFLVPMIGWCLGEVADPLVGWFDNYSDKTKTEGRDKDSGNYDRDGTAAREDVYYHAIATVYGMFILGCIDLGSYIFMGEFLNINGDDGFTCDVASQSQSTYSQVATYAKAMTDRASCLENIGKIFDIMDLNNDGMISRCEDAKLQYASGSEKAYALKFSSAYSRASANQICTQDFDY
jgi:hypothetical protein